MKEGLDRRRRAINSTTTFNSRLLNEKRLKGAYYYEPHSNTIQMADSYLVHNLVAPTPQQQEKQLQEFSQFYEEKRKQNPELSVTNQNTGITFSPFSTSSPFSLNKSVMSVPTFIIKNVK